MYIMHAYMPSFLRSYYDVIYAPYVRAVCCVCVATTFRLRHAARRDLENLLQLRHCGRKKSPYYRSRNDVRSTTYVA